MNNKYEFTGQTIVSFGITLKQIRRKSDGLIGGYIESEKNLSFDGDSWVSGKAQVSGNAQVYGNAQVSGNALVFGNAQVYGDALVFGNALVYGNALVFGNALVYGDALVFGNAQVYGDAQVSGNALVFGNAQVYGNALVFGNALVYGDALVFGNALVYGDAVIKSKACLIVLVLGLSYNVTITPQNVSIGCKLYDYKTLRHMTKEQAINEGILESEVSFYHAMIMESLNEMERRNGTK